MPASLPGATLAQNQGNPTQGRAVTFDPLSGPKGSPLDRDATGNCSTGGLSTGIGFGPASVIGLTASASIVAQGLNDDQIPGTREPSYGTQNTFLSRYLYIGGGRMAANATSPDKYSVPYLPSEYTAGIAIAAAGNGGARESGATGFAMRMSTAAAGVATGAAIETTYLNRTGVALTTGQSAHGVNSAALAAAS